MLDIDGPGIAFRDVAVALRLAAKAMNKRGEFPSNSTLYNIRIESCVCQISDLKHVKMTTVVIARIAVLVRSPRTGILWKIPHTFR